MKTLLVTMQLGRSYSQGAERYVASLGACLRRRGHEVSFLAGDPLRFERPMGLGQTVDAEQGLFACPTQGWMAVVGIKPRRLETWLSECRPDIVHVNTAAHIGVGTMIACRRLRIPVVVTTHDYWWICPKGTVLRADRTVCDGTPGWAECIQCILADNRRKWVQVISRLPGSLSAVSLAFCYVKAATQGMTPGDMVRWPRRRSILVPCLNECQGVIFPSRAICEALAPRLSHRRWRIIPNGLPGEWFANPRPQAEGPRSPETLTVGYAGAMAPHKAPHLLVEAIRRLEWRETTLRLAGPITDPAYWQQLQNRARGLRVEFAGTLRPDQMPSFLRSLDILAMTSVWPENCPYVVLEAQAAGVSVVGSRLGGLVEHIRTEKLLFEPGSVESLAAALDYARLHPEACRPGRILTIEEMTDAVEGTYREAMQAVSRRTENGRPATADENGTAIR